ncbi:MAG TPA: bifunctional serine/threonine-protein kinase/formylglycine-generating enzyme family protein [Planctomycetota bacterium]
MLERCLDVPQDQRAAFLDAQCASDPDLRREVESVLSAQSKLQGLVNRPPAAEETRVSHHIGKYTVIREIGRGGMGAVVWLARDEVFGREVALKIVTETASSAQELARFDRESKSAGKLTHAHIVKVYDEGRTDHSRFFAMEYIVGHDVALEIRRQDERNPDAPPILPPFAGPKYIPAVAALCADAAEALQHAHDAGIVHRDVKPRNLLLDREGRVFVADFGLARDSRFGSISQSETILGTPYYMSPEQARVVDAGFVDNRTDVYSLGVVLYELLTLQRPFDGKTSEEIRARIQREEAKPVQRVNHRVPADLAAICHGAMSKSLSVRYRSAGEMAQDLRRFLSHEGIVFRPPPWWRRAAARVQRHRRTLAIAAAFVVAVLTVGWWVKYDSARQRLVDMVTELQSLDPAALIFERPALTDAVHANPLAPRLTVRVSDASGGVMAGKIGYRVIDPVTGQPGPMTELGQLPVVTHPVAYGYLRLVATIEGAGVREFSRYFLRGGVETLIEHVVRDGDQDVAEMVSIDGGVLELHDEDCPMSGINHQRLVIEPFLLDRYEVSNANWRLFLRARPQMAPPAYWSRITPGSPEDALPVTMISWFEAQAYAEWVGKRLPTHAEWAFAARGPEGRRYPWANAVPGEYRGNTRQPVSVGLSGVGQIDAYLQRAHGVRSDGDAATPSGLFHMLGNVAEWTESLAPEVHGGEFQPRFHTRIVIGEAWYAANWVGRPGDLTTISQGGPEKSHSCFWIGFRCAKSR